jgi:hypothetical protein
MANISLGGSVGTTGTAILGSVTVAIPSDANYTLMVSEYTNQFLNVTSGVSLSATRNIVVPVTEGVTYIVQNNTTGSQTIQIIGSTGTGIDIPNGSTVSVVCDGTNFLQSSGGSSIAFSGDLSGNDTMQEVIGILNNALPGLSDGYLNWNGSSWQFSSIGSGFTPGGDLAGSGTDQTVTGIQNNPVSSAIPSDGYTFIWDQLDGYWKPEAAVFLLKDGYDTDFGVFAPIASSQAQEYILGTTGEPVLSTIATLTTTTDGYETILVLTPPTNSLDGWSVSVQGLNVQGGSPNGDYYRADLTFDAITVAGTVTLNPTAPFPVNIRYSGGGVSASIYVTIVSNTVVISVMGIASITYDWSAVAQVCRTI